MTRSIFRHSIIAGALVALGLGLSGPAAAGGSHFSYGYYGPAYYGGYHYAGYGYRGYGRGYRHGRRHRGGGGKGAAIALGVIGGAIILNELAEDRARRQYYEDRRYDSYADRPRRPYYDRSGLRAQPIETGYAGEETLPAENYGGAGEDADIDRRLDGGPEPIRLSAGAAYSTCIGHVRQMLADRDFMLAAPAQPDTAENIAGTWKMTANVTAQDQQGEEWNRAMYCEADEGRVYLLELI